MSEIKNETQAFIRVISAIYEGKAAADTTGCIEGAAQKRITKHHRVRRGSNGEEESHTTGCDVGETQSCTTSMMGFIEGAAQKRISKHHRVQRGSSGEEEQDSPTGATLEQRSRDLSNTGATREQRSTGSYKSSGATREQRRGAVDTNGCDAGATQKGTVSTTGCIEGAAQKRITKHHRVRRGSNSKHPKQYAYITYLLPFYLGFSY
ncbi:hypothetical protein RUM44_001154 [Polyplax serrata]|uniref:Uncharacterized protein n=1 Tax=Polyplax serrata TaxID=468196 RepID=A0ABR1B6R9_POLSC